MKLALLGDIALFGHMSIDGNPDWEKYFSQVASILSQMDYVVGNLETPFSVKKRTYGSKSAYICSEPSNVSILKFLNLNAVTIANNHIFDYGTEGYETTKKILENNGIEWFGAEGKELNVEIDGNKLSFLGFCCYSTNPQKCVPYGEYGVNEFDYASARNLLAEKRERGFLPVLSVHSGIEHVNYPSIDLITIAQELAENEPMIFYGHHPHVVQAIYEYHKALLAYSLGNFCFDDVYSSVSKSPLITLSENNRSTCILVVDIKGNQICSWDIIPVYIGKEHLDLSKGVSHERIAEYLKPITELESSEYTRMRNQLIAEYIAKRREKRDYLWYLKRLRPRYLFILVNSYLNALKYKHCITNNLFRNEGFNL